MIFLVSVALYLTDRINVGVLQLILDCVVLSCACVSICFVPLGGGVFGWLILFVGSVDVKASRRQGSAS